MNSETGSESYHEPTIERSKLDQHETTEYRELKWTLILTCRQ